MQHRMYFDEAIQRAEKKEGDTNELPLIEGYAIVANVRGVTPWFSEEIDKKAITKALAEPNLDVASLWNHDMSMPLGRYPDTLELVQDERGLFTRTKPTNTSYARDLITNIDAGVVRQMSFGFWPVAEKYDDSGDVPHFIVTEMRLFDTSPVTMPFYRETEVWVKRCADVLQKRMQQIGKNLRSNHLEYHAHIKRQLEINKARLALI